MSDPTQYRITQQPYYRPMGNEVALFEAAHAQGPDRLR